MAMVLEYCVVTAKWGFHFSDRPSGRHSIRPEEYEENETINMENFEDAVNDKLAEGWRPTGSPQFSDGWGYNKGARAYQALVRERTIELAVLAEVTHAVVAEQVRPLRTSLRNRAAVMGDISGNRN